MAKKAGKGVQMFIEGTLDAEKKMREGTPSPIKDDWENFKNTFPDVRQVNVSTAYMAGYYDMHERWREIVRLAENGRIHEAKDILLNIRGELEEIDGGFPIWKR